MKSVLVDPRDAEWEVSAPRYRVVFWPTHEHSIAYDVSDANDAAEVARWAEENIERMALDGTYEIYVVVETAGQIGLLFIGGLLGGGAAR